MVLKFLTLMFLYSMEFLHPEYQYQSVEWQTVELKIVGSIPASAVNFLFDISLNWGNEPNGEQQEEHQEQQEQQQLKLFLGLWPMAADKNCSGRGSVWYFTHFFSKAAPYTTTAPPSTAQTFGPISFWSEPWSCAEILTHAHSNGHSQAVT